MKESDFIQILEQLRKSETPRTYFGGKTDDLYFDSDVCDLQLCFIILLGYFDVFKNDIPQDDNDVSILLHKESSNAMIQKIWESMCRTLHPDFSKWMKKIFDNNLSKYRSEESDALLYNWITEKLLFHPEIPDENPAMMKDFLLDLLDGTEAVMNIPHNKRKLLVIGNENLFYKKVYTGKIQFESCILCPEDNYFYACSLIIDTFFKNQRCNDKLQIIKRDRTNKEAFPFEEARFNTIYSFAEAFVRKEDNDLVNSLEIKDVLTLLDEEGIAYVFCQDYDHLIPEKIFNSYDTPFVAQYFNRRSLKRLYVCRKITPQKTVRTYNVYDFGDWHYFYDIYDEILAETIQIINTHGNSWQYQELTKDDFLYNFGHFRKSDQLNFVYRNIDELLIRHTNHQVPVKELSRDDIVEQSSFGKNPFSISLSPKYYHDADIFDKAFSDKLYKDSFKFEKEERISKSWSDRLFLNKHYNDLWRDITLDKAPKEKYLIENRVMTMPGLLYYDHSFLRVQASLEHPICYAYCQVCPTGDCQSDIDEVTISPEFDEDFIIYQLSTNYGKHILVAPTKEEQHAYYLKKKEEYLLKNIDLVNEIRDDYRKRISVDLHYLKHDAAHYLSSIESAKLLFDRRLNNEGVLRLDDEFRSGHTVKEHLEDISKCVKHITSFLEQMTYLTDVLPKRSVQISSLLKTFADNCLATKNYVVELELEPSMEGKTCLLDERIHKAFDNILSNAERHAFTEKDPRKNYRLRVQATCEDDIVIITFANNGTPPDPTLTEGGYFTRGLHVGKTGHSGFGGSIIREAIEAQNGIVHLYLNKDKEYPFIIEIKLPVYYD